MDGNGGCCIARWTDGGYDMSKMDMIMLKYRPIAPKPVVSDNGSSLSPTSDGSRHAKPPARGRKKTNNNNSKRCNGKKRKSNSPDDNSHQVSGSPHDIDHHRLSRDDDDQDQNKVTLLPLFPESPDLMNSQGNNMTTWLNFDSNNNYYYNSNMTPGFEDNYGKCHGKSW